MVSLAQQQWSIDLTDPGFLSINCFVNIALTEMLILRWCWCVSNNKLQKYIHAMSVINHGPLKILDIDKAVPVVIALMLERQHFQMQLLRDGIFILIYISLKSVSGFRTIYGYKVALISIITCRGISVEPLPETKTQFTYSGMLPRQITW